MTVIPEPQRLETAEPHRGPVFIVDDDPRVLSGLDAILSLAGLDTMTFESAEAFLAYVGAEHAGCLLADIRLPGMNGLDLQNAVVQRAPLIAVIIITGHADVACAVRAMKAGALEILQKPFGSEQLLSHVHRALAVSRAKAKKAARTKDARQKLDAISPREKEVLDLVLEGRTNREIALSLAISPRTVEVHRASLMKKLEVEDLVGLVRLTDSCVP